MEGLCPCGHEPTGSIVPVSQSGVIITITIMYVIKRKGDLFVPDIL